ncbi:MAG: DMT family transporter [Cyanobacteria bacterium]|nr:DMT family transporter [Cyanobacteriota bacterium]MDW8201006.1 DMT family transporter [Cyanobacteriota bacterium SKYGB_h_bin112]
MVTPSRWQIRLILATGVLAVSTSSVLVRLAFQAAGTSSLGFSLVLAASRLTLAALTMLAITWSTARYRHQQPRLPDVHSPQQPKTIMLGIAAGICLAIHFAAWISSLAYTSVAASTALVTTNPIWVALLSWFWLGERPRRLAMIGIGIAMAGSLVVAYGGSSTPGNNPLLGNTLALVGAWMVSFYLMLSTIAQQRGSNLSVYVLVVYSTAAIVLLPLPSYFHTSYRGYPSLVYGWIILLAAIPQLIGHTALTWSVRWIAPTQVTLAILLEPIIASGIAYLIFQELPTHWVIAGGLLIVSGTIFVTREQSRLVKFVKD